MIRQCNVSNLANRTSYLCFHRSISSFFRNLRSHGRGKGCGKTLAAAVAVHRDEMRVLMLHFLPLRFDYFDNFSDSNKNNKIFEVLRGQGVQLVLYQKPQDWVMDLRPGILLRTQNLLE